ncbi:MAG: hypothetical protein V4677_03270, partial [Bacteroidota bacterium]
MKIKYIVLVLIVIFFKPCFSQNETKLAKNLEIVLSGSYDKTAPMLFDLKESGKQAFEELALAFKMAFFEKKFNIST